MNEEHTCQYSLHLRMGSYSLRAYLHHYRIKWKISQISETLVMASPLNLPELVYDEKFGAYVENVRKIFNSQGSHEINCNLNKHDLFI